MDDFLGIHAGGPGLIVQTLPARLPGTQRRLLALRRRYGVELRTIFECELHFAVDVDRLGRVLAGLVAREEILRCYYPKPPAGGTASAVPSADHTLTVEVRALDSKDAVESVRARLTYEPLGLERRPYARFVFLRRADGSGRLLGALPAMNADRRSVVLFVGALQKAYETGRVDPPGPHFHDLAAWLSASASEAAKASAESFWRGCLDSVPWHFQLPIERRRPGRRTFRSASRPWSLPASVVETAVGRDAHASDWLRTQLITAAVLWQATVTTSQWTYVGVTVAGRGYDELRDAIGPYDRCLPLPCEADGATTIAGLVERVQKQFDDLEAFHEYVDLAQGSVAFEALPCYPLCVDVWRSDDVIATGAPEFLLDRLSADTDTYGVKLTCEVRGEQLLAEICYDESLYTSQAIECLAEQLNGALEATVACPAARISELGARVVAAGDVAARELDSAAVEIEAAPAFAHAVHELFDRRADAAPDAIAVVDGDSHVSYGALCALTNRLADRLRRCDGIGPEALVALHMPTSLDAIVAILGVFKAGAAYLPIDPRWPTERVETVLRESGAAVVLSSDDLTEAVRDIRLSTSQPSTAARSTHPAQLAYVLYTSGTSGRPKGVMITHRGLTNYLVWSASYYRTAESRGSVVHSPLGFDFTLTTLLSPLIVGRCVYLCRGESPLEELVNVLSTLDEVSIVKLTPTSIEAVRRLIDLRRASCRVTSLVIGGEALWGSSALRSLAERVGATVVNEYGPTECVVGSSVHRIESGETIEGAIPIGRAIAHTTLRLLTPAGDEAAVWVPAEICIGGWGVARGYRNNPRLTASSFVPDTRGGGRLYRTGDWGRRARNGDLHFLGRHDAQVKIRGYRIELGEVEEAIRRLEAVADCAATIQYTGEPNPQPQLVAFIAAVHEAELNEADLRRALATRLPAYMIPAALHIVAKLPLTLNGKVDIATLQAEVVARSRRQTDIAAPQTDVERMLHRVYREVLGREDVGLDDNFFTLGGDSIASIQMLARANQAGLRLRPRDLRDHPTIRALAAIAGLSRSPASTSSDDPRHRDIPLAPPQARFFEWRLVEPSHFNQSLLLSAPGRWGAAQIHAAFDAIVDHHDALRLRFELTAAGYRQSHASGAEREFITFVDRERVQGWRGAFDRLVSEAQRGIEMGRAPLLNVVCAHGGPDETLIYIVAHHLVVDHVSWSIIIDDLRRALDQVAAGQPIQLPPCSASYGDWVAYLAARAGHLPLDHERAYWLADRWSEVPELRRELSDDAAGDVDAPATVSVTLNRTDTDALRGAASAAYNTNTQELLLTALALACAQWSGNTVLSFDIEGHGRDTERDAPDVTRTVGWFTAIHPVYVALTRPGDLATSIRDVKEALRAVPGDGSTYGLLRYLSPDPDTRQTCSALHRSGILFNYLGDLYRAAGVEKTLRVIKSLPAPDRSAMNQLPYPLEIGVSVLDGELRATFGFNRRMHRTASIERLADAFLRGLTALTRHCCSQDRTQPTPSDFPLADLTAGELAALIGDKPNVADIYPLTETQKGILYHSVGGSASYVVQLCALFSGRLNVRAFEESWRRVIERHPALRTSFEWEAVSEPLQLVHRQVDIPFATVEWDVAPGEDVRRRLDTWAAGERSVGLDLRKAPLHRFGLVRIRENAYGFMWMFHHILLDGWSTSNVLREVFAGYEELTSGRPSVERPGAPYRDYIEWLRSRPWEDARRYWRKVLQGIETGGVIELPAVTSATPACARRHAEVNLRFGEADSAALRTLAATCHVTQNAVVQAAWALVLARYCATDDVIFGATVSGRPYDLPEMENRIGLFINTVPIRIRVRPDAIVGTYVRAVHTQLQELLEYDYMPLVEMPRLCGLRAGEQLFESIVVFENYPMRIESAVLRNELTIDEVWTVEQTNYPLTLVVGGDGGGLTIRARYDTSRFAAAAVDAMLARLRATVAWMCRSRAHRLGNCLVDDVDEQPCVTVSRRSSQATEPLHRIFERRAAAHADAVAVVDGHIQVSYGTLNRRANQLAHYLIDIGVRPGSLVAICVNRSADMIAVMLAVLKASAVYVPLDPRYPPRRLRDMAAGVAVVVADKRSHMHFAGETRRVIDIETDASAIALASPLNVTTVADSCQVAYLMYTSGSSGTPKGTLITHHSVTSLLAAICDLYDIGDAAAVWSCFHSIAFDFSVWEIFGPLLTGGRVAVVPYWVTRAPEQFHEWIEREAVTVLSQTPSAFLQLLAAGGLSPRTCTVQWVVFGGEAVYPKQIVADCRELIARGVRFINMYGITETTVHVTHRLLHADERCGDGSYIGEALPHLRMHLLDRHLRPVPEGVSGEICVAGAGVALGYMGAPRTTAERFVPDPFACDGGRLYRSGDLGRLVCRSDVEYLGRADDQMKIRGFRVEPGEIRSVLLQDSSVQEALVRMVRDHSGDRVVVAYVVPTEEDAATARLWHRLREQLPEHMLPTAILPIPTIPLTDNGKTDYAALPGLADARPFSESTIVPPQTWEQELVADIWREVLGLNRVGIHDDFFTSGGDSIKALRLVGRLKSLGFDQSVESVFLHPTVAQLAHTLTRSTDPHEAVSTSRIPDRADHATAVDAGAAQVVDSYPATQLQLGMLLHTSELVEEFTPYHNVTLLRIEGRFDEDRFSRVVGGLAARHPVLRTAFALRADAPAQQVVYRSVTVPVTVERLERMSAAEQQAHIEAWREREKRRLFAYDAAPLLRFHVAVADDRTFYVGLTEHHSILDGWSVASLLTELFQRYVDEYGRQEPVEAYVPDTNLFRAYVALEQDALQSPQHRGFWADYLREYVPLQLPPSPDSVSLGVRRAVRKKRVRLDDATAAGLQAMARAAHAPLKSVMLGAHLAVVGFIAATDEPSTGVITHGRPDVEGSEAALGLFLNTLPLRLKLANWSWMDWIRAVFAEEKRILPFRRYPLGAMRDGSGRALELTNAFNYTHFHVYEQLQPHQSLKVVDTSVHEETNFDLVTDITRLSGTGALDLTLSYDAGKFSDEQIEAWIRCYLRCFQLMIADPSACTHQRSLAEDAPATRLTERPSARGAVWEDLQRVMASGLPGVHPDRIAITDGERHLSYRELARLTSSFAGRLCAFGVAPEIPVVVALKKSLEQVVAALAVIKAGGVYVPIDVSNPVERAMYILRDTAARIVITDRDGPYWAPAKSEAIVHLDAASVLDSTDSPSVQWQVVPENLAYIMYTSGTTGKPKGVAVHHGLANLLTWQARAVPIEDQRIFQYASPGFDASIHEILTTLMGGNTLTIVPDDLRRDFIALSALVIEEQIQCMFAPYTALNALFSAARSCGTPLTTLRTICHSGEAIVLDDELRRFVDGGGALHNLYGPTESHVVTACRVGPLAPKTDVRASFIGRGIDHTEIPIVDRWLRPLPLGSIGELCIASPGVARNYHRAARLTAERFIPSPACSARMGERAFRTGDWGYSGADGGIWFRGRADSQIKLRGYRIELDEVRHSVLQYPGIVDAVISVVQTTGEKSLCAYVVSDVPIDGKALQAFIARSLPRYMVPSYVVRIPSRPLTKNGKTDYAALPPVSTPLEEVPEAAPTGEVALALQDIWRELLNREAVIGAHHDFLDLGGNSLLLLQLQLKILARFNLKLPFAKLAVHSSFARMAHYIENVLKN